MLTAATLSGYNVADVNIERGARYRSPETPGFPTSSIRRRASSTPSSSAPVSADWRPRPCWHSTPENACWCWSGITPRADSRTSFTAPDTSGTWASTTSARCAPGAPMRALFDEITEGRLKWNADAGGLRPHPDRGPFLRFRERRGALRGAHARVLSAGRRGHRPISGRRCATRRAPADCSSPRRPCRGRWLAWPDRCCAGDSCSLRAANHRRKLSARLTSNRELIAVLTGQWGDYGLPPGQSSFGMHAIIAEHYLEGAFYPVGGASRIAAGIAPADRAGGRPDRGERGGGANPAGRAASGRWACAWRMDASCARP